MHCRSPPFAAMGMHVYGCVWGVSNDDPPSRTCNPFSLSRFAISPKEGMDRVLEDVTPCLPLPSPPR